MVTIKKILGYKRSGLLIMLIMILAVVLCRSLICRPFSLIQKNRQITAELETNPRSVRPNEHVAVPDSLNLDLAIIRIITNGGCMILQGNLGQILKEDGMELIQYEVAYSGTYANIMNVWQNISYGLPETARITYCRIAPERDMDRKGWSLVNRLTVQAIRLL